MSIQCEDATEDADWFCRAEQLVSRHPASGQLIRPQVSVSSTVAGMCGSDDDKKMATTADEGVSAAHEEVREYLLPTEGETEDIAEELTAEEETEPKKAVATPDQPTKADIDHHWLDHLPFRNWCSVCVEGRGRERPHHRTREGKRLLPTVCLDYFFVSKKGAISRQEWDNLPEGERGAKVLVVRESVNKCTFAHAVPQKGADDAQYAVECLLQDIKWMGFSRIALKSDNEPAIVRLLAEALKALRIEGLEQIGEEHSPEYYPQSNGAVEAAVGAVKGLMRTLLLGLEQRLGHRIPPDHPVVAWLATRSVLDEHPHQRR